MDFQWPGMLWLLALVPALAGAYLLLMRRRTTARVSTVFALRDSRGRAPGFRRHVPALVLLAGVLAAVLALARPFAAIELAARRGTVILAMDVSGSMRATDITPNRMEAVKSAAEEFVARQPQKVRVGIVAFSGNAVLVQPPTTERDKLTAAIGRLRPQMFTAIGSGLLASLDAIFGPPPDEAAADTSNQPLEHTPTPEPPPPVAPGSYKSAVIILLSDGQSNQGPDPLDAAERAADKGVRVYTVGVGTREGANVGFEGFTFHAILDEATLKRIAQVTGGAYFKASSAGELRGIYESLGTRLALEKERTEITALFAAVAVGLFLVGGLISLAWFNRVA